MTRFHSFLSSLFLFVLSLAVFTIGIGHTEVVSFDSRFYLFATEMWRHGFTWFPTTYGQPYPDYPVSSTLMIYAVSLLFGGLTKFTAVLPSAVAASFVVVITKKIGDLYDKRLGLAAVALLFLTLTFLKSARAISLDIYPLLAATLCFYTLARASLLKIKRNGLLLGACFVFGFVMRGPVGLVIPAGVVCVFHLCEGNYRRFFIDGLHAFFWLVLGTAALLGLAYHTGGLPFMVDVARMEVVGRIDNYFLPYTFYFTDSLGSYALSYPLAVLVFFGYLWAVFRNQLNHWPRAGVVLQWMAWALIILLGMSLPGDKKVRYILGISPAIALIAAYPLVMDSGSVFLKRLRVLETALFTFLPVLFLGALLKVMFALPASDSQQGLPFLPLVMFLVVMQAWSLRVWFREKNDASRGLQALMLAACVFVVLDLSLIEPIEINLDSARVLVNNIETMRAQRGAALVFYKERPDGLPIKYLVNMNTDDDPVFIESTTSLMAIKNPAVIVTSLDYYQALTARQKLNFNQLIRGRLGHVPVVVLVPVK